MSVLRYNGITLPYIYVSQFSQEAVYEESRTDWFCTKFDITVQTVIDTSYIPLIAPDLLINEQFITNSPADIMSVIRSRLLKPRRALSFKVNDVELIPADTGLPGTVDVQNGPQPMFCDPVTLTATTFLVTYRIVAHYWESNTVNTDDGFTLSTRGVTNRQGNAVLYNRWSETVDIDENMFTRYTRTGKLAIRSDNRDGLKVDDVRPSMAVVGVLSGFTRKSAKYTVDPSGLFLQYTVEDVEQFKMPPEPAFWAEGEYIESCTKNAAMRWGYCRVHLKGSKTTAQTSLIQVAVGVAASKLVINGAQTAAPGTGRFFNLLNDSSIKVGLYKNEVEVSMKVLLKQTKKRVNNVAAYGQINTFVPGSDQINYQPSYRDRGTASIVLQAAAYYDPSLRNVSLNNNGQLNQGLEVGQAGVQREP